jgi:hypothetical protein
VSDASTGTLTVSSEEKATGKEDVYYVDEQVFTADVISSRKLGPAILAVSEKQWSGSNRL